MLACSPTAAANIEAIISLTVVLPLLPVTIATFTGSSARHALAKVCIASNVSGTSQVGILTTWAASLTKAPNAPLFATSPINWFASKRSPLIATKNSPELIARLSVTNCLISVDVSFFWLTTFAIGSNRVKSANVMNLELMPHP